MPDHRPTGERTPAQRQADHASLAPPVGVARPRPRPEARDQRPGRARGARGRLADPAPARGARRRGDPTRRAAAPGHPSRRDGRARDASAAPAPAAAAPGPADPGDHAPASPGRTMALSPAVGVFHPEAAVGKHVRAGDRIAFVDLLGIAQDVVAPIDGTLVEVFPRPARRSSTARRSPRSRPTSRSSPRARRSPGPSPTPRHPANRSRQPTSRRTSRTGSDASPDADAEASA